MADFEYVSQGDATPAGDVGPQPPLNLNHHFSRVTLARKESTVKQSYKYFQIPGIANLAGGLPNAAFFPYDTLEAQIAQPERFHPTPNYPNDPSSLSSQLASTSIKKPDTAAPLHLTVPHASSSTDPLQKIDLTSALQYGTAQGYPPLYSFIRQFTRENLQPNVPYLNGPEIILTVGSTDGMSKTLEAFSNVWSEGKDWIREREGILCEEFAFMGAIQQCRPRGLSVNPVKIDHEGILPYGPGGLEDVLENWDESKGKRPHLLYTVSIGQNPTSGTTFLQRRKEIYALCSKYDVLIIEDDPYWYLQFPSAAAHEAQARGATPPSAPVENVPSNWKSSGFPFLDSLVASYLNIDTDGRVIRLDTFSKTVAPGCRLGWITAQPAIVERLLRITETSTQQPSGFVQAMIAELLIGPQAKSESYLKKTKQEQLAFSGWQVGGWVRWLEGLRGSYERRMNRMCTLLETGRFLLKQQTPIKASESEWAVISKTKIYSFNWPRGGMFIWVKFHFETHPLWGKEDDIDGPRLAGALFDFLTLKPQLVLANPGQVFSPTDEILEKEGWKYLRLCFAAVSEEEVDKSSQRFADGAKAFWAVKSRKELEEIEDAAASAAAEGAHPGLANLGLALGC